MPYLSLIYLALESACGNSFFFVVRSSRNFFLSLLYLKDGISKAFITLNMLSPQPAPTRLHSLNRRGLSKNYRWYTLHCNLLQTPCPNDFSLY